MSRRNAQSPTTNRMAIGQILVCMGCCCGQPDKGHPAVPAEWLKAEWKKRLLLKKIHLSISGCLGPCDRSNVVAIVTPARSIWLGGIERQDQYRELLDWASACEREGKIQPLPEPLQRLEFGRFHGSVEMREEVA
jgi:predicted metal-binding protein